MKIIKISVVMLMTATILSCHKGEKILTQEVQLEDIKKESKQEKYNKAPLAIANGFAADTVATIVFQAGQPAKNMDWDKKIIKTANVKLEVKNYAAYNQDMHNLVRRYGAYIASEQQVESEEKINNDLSIKVPVAQFENLMNALPAKDVKLLEKNISTEDVTGEVVDTKSRMVAKKAVRDRYLELMKQAKNMKEVLEVQNEINDIQEEIESGTGRVDFLTHQSAYSTIHLTYFQVLQVNFQDGQTPSFFTKLLEAFSNGSAIIMGLFLGLVTIWPLLLVGVLIWFGVRKWKGKSLKMVVEK